MSLIKLTVFLILMYFIYQTGRNLLQAVLEDGSGQRRMRGSSSEPKARQGPDYRAPHEQIEDAKWEDL